MIEIETDEITYITLPAIANIGDKITIQGKKNGWVVSQNPNQSFYLDEETQTYLPAIWQETNEHAFVFDRDYSTNKCHHESDGQPYFTNTTAPIHNKCKKCGEFYR